MALPSMLCGKGFGAEGALVGVEGSNQRGPLISSFIGGVLSAAT